MGGRYGIDAEDFDVEFDGENYCRDELPESQGGSRAIDALSSNTQATIMQMACWTGLAPAIIDGGNEEKVKHGPWETANPEHKTDQALLSDVVVKVSNLGLRQSRRIYV